MAAPRWLRWMIDGRVHTALALTAVHAMVANAQILAKPKPIQPVITVATCTNAAKTSVEGFYVNPKPAFNPVAGQVVEMLLDIRNICNGPLNIPWRIDRFGVTVASGVQQNVAAGALFEVMATWPSVLHAT